MREEEIVGIVEREVEKAGGRMLGGGERVGEEGEGEGEYEVVRVRRKEVEEYGRGGGKGRHFGELEQQYHPLSMIEPKRPRRKQKKVTLDRII